MESSKVFLWVLGESFTMSVFLGARLFVRNKIAPQKKTHFKIRATYILREIIGNRPYGFWFFFAQNCRIYG
ncbi:MAG: hypothetical protein AUK31_07030 [Fibrobacteres bacterium CG2_30_45_31]|nr:MAG: hypothetical protein AUK31_07030 [Fibrobacteres bacterium CG2_30_45_31]